MVYADPRMSKYVSHRGHAQGRGIAFEFTFDEWWQIWESSGRWAERGIRRGQYVMARFGDQGAYAIGNVEIITCGENINQPQVRAKQSVTITGRTLSPTHCKSLSRAKLGNSNARGKSWSLSVETRARQSLGQMGNQKALGKIWITNGLEDRLVDPPKRLSRRWQRGRSKIRGNSFAKKP